MDRPLVIFLSPHFDDIALSCGGIAARLSRSGARCIAVTVCAAPAQKDAALSEYAEGLHARWESAGEGTPGDVNNTRRDEESKALRLLGLEPVWLDVPDAPYRQGNAGEYHYRSDEQLFGTVAPEEKQKLVPAIADKIRRIAEETGAERRVRVFAPLGVGHHVDHQLAFWAARRLGPRYGVLFYEDFPYAIKPETLKGRLDELSMEAQPLLTPITDLIGIKIAAISKYKSQLPVLFGSSEAMPGAVRDYARSVAAGAPGLEYAERVWRIAPVYRLG